MEVHTRGEAMSRSRFPDGFRIMQGKQEFVTYIEHSSLRIWYSEVPWRYESHCHSAVEIIMPVKGEVIYQVEDATYRVQADEVLIVPPNCVHGLSMNAGSARYLLLFEPDSIFSMRDMRLVEDILQTPIYLSSQPELQEAVRSLLNQCINCYDRREFMWNTLCYSYLMQMYARLGQSSLARSAAHSSRSVSGRGRGYRGRRSLRRRGISARRCRRAAGGRTRRARRPCPRGRR